MLCLFFFFFYEKRTIIKRELASLIHPEPCLRALPGSPATKKQNQKKKKIPNINYFFPILSFSIKYPAPGSIMFCRLKCFQLGLEMFAVLVILSNDAVVRLDPYSLAKVGGSALEDFLRPHF